MGARRSEILSAERSGDHTARGRTSCTHSKDSTGDAGYALPSVLFLITILGLVAASMITLQYFRHQVALMAIEKARVDYATESGIVRVVSGLRAGTRSVESTTLTLHQVAGEDGLQQSAYGRPWGLFFIARAEATSKRKKSGRTAIVGQTLPPLLDNALVYSNQSHQLVLTGTSEIWGDVVTGRGGVTTGNLPDHTAPTSLPIHGAVNPILDPELPRFDTKWLNTEISYINDLLITNGACEAPRGSASGDPQWIAPGTLINDTVVALDSSRILVSRGDVRIGDKASLKGLVCIIAGGTVTIHPNSTIQNALIFSIDSISIASGFTGSGQFIAPIIQVSRGVQLTYPSVVFSHILSTETRVSQSIRISDSCTIGGFVGMWSEAGGGLSDNLVTVSPGSMIIGVVYSNTRIQSDGNIYGCLLTEDFYFYEAPTTYLGWLRMGVIERGQLPPAYLMPLGFGADQPYEILDWL